MVRTATSGRLDELSYKFLSNEELSKLPSSFAEPAWWKEAVVYQIWPASFKDSNGDGWGDLKGVLSKLDYLKDLGADVVWLSPVYKSPHADFYYDVSDYLDIAPEFGTLQDIDAIIKGLKERGMRLVMDLVVNHTSDEHKWFVQSRSSLDNDKRDWYIWRKGKVGPDGSKLPPNNWSSFFGGSAWSYDAKTDEWYLCLFAKKQPDLNWENTDVREEVHRIMRWWLDRGVSGFRCDVISMFSKVYGEPLHGDPRPGLHDAPITRPDSEYQPAAELFSNGPRIHQFIRELNEEVLSHYDTITVGETPMSHDPEILLPWTHPARKELRMNFTFSYHDLDRDAHLFIIPREFHLSELKKTVNKWQTYIHAHSGWHANYADNHDGGRLLSRWLSDAPEHRRHAAKLFALWHTTQSGTLYCYQGTELGMKNIPSDWGIEEYKDIATVNFYNDCKELLAQGKKAPATPEEIERFACKKARDNARTPVQWSSGHAAGFTDEGVKPWMRAQEEDARRGWNAEAQQASRDPLSVREFWKKALGKRKELRSALVYGNFNLLHPEDGEVFAYVRNAQDGESAVLVVLNWSAKDKVIGFDADEARKAQSQLEHKASGIVADLGELKRRARPILTSYEDEGEGEPTVFDESGTIKLRPYEGIIYALEA